MKKDRLALDPDQSPLVSALDRHVFEHEARKHIQSALVMASRAKLSPREIHKMLTELLNEASVLKVMES